MSEPETQGSPFDALLEEMKKGNAQALRYSRIRILGTWLALAFLAILTSLALILATRNAETNLKQTDDIAKLAHHTANQADATADKADASTDDITAYLRGEQGLPGVPGANGQDGTPGQPGSEGSLGPRGPQGDQGEPGAPGAMGTTGTTGPAGPVGPVGEAGPAGPAGLDGTSGPQGEKGAKGDTGATGPTGPQGPAGPTGPAALPVTAAAAGALNGNPSKTVTVRCASGRVTGGGYALIPQDSRLVLQHSTPEGVNGWTITVAENGLPDSIQWQVLAFAQCVG